MQFYRILSYFSSSICINVISGVTLYHSCGLGIQIFFVYRSRLVRLSTWREKSDNNAKNGILYVFNNQPIGM